jgi:WD40 repeat protein
VATYRGHSTCVRQVAYNSDKGTYASIDDLGMRLWKVSDGGCGVVTNLKDLHFPNLKSNFVTAIMYSNHVKLFFCPCLDGNLRIYKHDLKIKSCLPWSESIVYDMAFVSKRDELLVAGAAGVKERYLLAPFLKWSACCGSFLQKRCSFDFFL